MHMTSRPMATRAPARRSPATSRRPPATPACQVHHVCQCVPAGALFTEQQQPTARCPRGPLHPALQFGPGESLVSCMGRHDCLARGRNAPRSPAARRCRGFAGAAAAAALGLGQALGLGEGGAVMSRGSALAFCFR
jgi:hypothetical protein